MADWDCRAQMTNYGDPIDCDWPNCECDPHADRAMAELIERGWLSSSGAEKLAAEVAHDERDACAKIADRYAESWQGEHGRSADYSIAKLISGRTE